jgi:hypothetical protein
MIIPPFEKFEILRKFSGGFGVPFGRLRINLSAPQAFP